MSLRSMGWILTPRTLRAGPSGLSVPWKASQLFVPGFPPPLRPSSVASLEEPSLVQLLRPGEPLGPGAVGIKMEVCGLR